LFDQQICNVPPRSTYKMNVLNLIQIGCVRTRRVIQTLYICVI